MAAVGGTKKVIGNKIATPLTEPKPGIAPTSKPMAQPMNIIIKLSGCSASRMPAPSSGSIESMARVRSTSSRRWGRTAAR